MKLLNTELFDNFNLMTDNQKSDWKFLSKFIFEKIGISLNTKKLKIKNLDGCWGGLQCKQYPDELSKLLVFLFENKININSYCEIGCERGGTFFIIDSFLRSINKNFTKSIAIDIQNKIEHNNFTEYKNKFNNVYFYQYDSKIFPHKEVYDFCFIDALHDYNSVFCDYNNVKNHSKIIAFHDIKLPNAGVSKLWKELNGKIEFLNEDNRFKIQMGIGIIYES